MNSNTDQGDETHMAESWCDNESFFQSKYTHRLGRICKVYRNLIRLLVFSLVSVCFYLLQLLSLSYHVQHSLEFQPLMMVS